MIIKKGDKLKEILTGRRYIIKNIEKQLFITLEDINNKVPTLRYCTIDFLTRNFELEGKKK